jgi:3-oxoacyl-[acyl-carrier-protein] synthase-1
MYIASIGMVCGVGLDAVSACAAKRAGLSAFYELPYLDSEQQAVIGSPVPQLDWTLSRSARLLELLRRPLAEILQRRPDNSWIEVPLILCLSEAQRPGGSANLAASVIDSLEERLGARFHPQFSSVFPYGHAGGFAALSEARRLMREHSLPACLVCGADSLLNGATLSWLEQNHRLKTPAQRDGAIPGEAGAAVLLQSRGPDDSVTEVAGLGFGKEAASILSQEPLLGQGLTAAARAALAEAQLPMHEIDLRVSDVTGELYGFNELPLVTGRLMRVPRAADQPLWHWSEAIGDTGAAAGIAQLVWVDQAFRKAYAGGRNALCLTASIDGARAAAVLRNKDVRHGL